MGKNGALLRQQKRQNTTYTFTSEQLEQRDRALIERFRKDHAKELEARYKKAEKQLEVRRDEIYEELSEEFKSGGDGERIAAVLQYTPSVFVKALREDFGWKVPGLGFKIDGRTKMAKLLKRVEEIIYEIGDDPYDDIKKFAEREYKESGIKFVLGEQE